MPRPERARPFRPVAGRLLRFVLAAGALALPPPVLHGALASAAGTAFEAAPFVLAGLYLRGSGARRLAALGSCGCGAIPGALGLPALALCWLSFGPVLAGLRLAAAGAGLFIFRNVRAPGDPEPDALAELERVTLAAFISALACEALRAMGESAGLGPFGAALAFAAGACAGALGPCASAAVATAAGLRASSAPAAAGLLATAGILPLLPRGSRAQPFGAARPAARCAPRRSGRLAYVTLALACGALAANGPGGFVHPRLLPAIALAALACLALALRGGKRASTSATLLLPLALLAAPLAGSPVPRRSVAAGNLADAFAGASLDFSGSAQTRDGRTLLVRYAITCCRADASPIALALDRSLGVRDGTWIEAGGTVVRDGSALALHAARWRVAPQPADPFVYR